MNETTDPVSIIASRSRRRRRRRQGGLLIIWVFLGILSYGLLWVSIIVTDDRSYLTIFNLNQQFEQAYKSSIDKRKMELQNTKKQRLRKQSEKTEQQQQSEKEHRWVAFGLWMTVIALSYHRIRRSHDHNQPSMNSNPHRYPRHHHTLSLHARRINQEAMVRTLRRINEERQARNEEIISIDAVEAFQRVLMQDREIWQGLLLREQQQQQQRNNSNQGATEQQIEACPQRNATEQDDGECSICLSDFCKDQTILRSLPCGHSFHRDCIDRWFERSTLCPICKSSLQDV